MELDGLVKPGLQDCKGPGLNWAVGIPCASKMFHNSYSTCKVTVNGRGLRPSPKMELFWKHFCRNHRFLNSQLLKISHGEMHIAHTTD